MEQISEKITRLTLFVSNKEYFKDKDTWKKITKNRKYVMEEVAAFARLVRNIYLGSYPKFLIKKFKESASIIKDNVNLIDIDKLHQDREVYMLKSKSTDETEREMAIESMEIINVLVLLYNDIANELSVDR